MEQQLTAKTFQIPELKGISATSIEEHLKLYQGYVKHANLIQAKIATLGDSPEDGYVRAELSRRFGFEFGGVRNHELYFSLLEGGPQPLDAASPLAQKIAADFGSVDAWRASFARLFSTRGPGWAMLGLDRVGGVLRSYWVDEQHGGHLPAVAPILAIDFWEHSYVADYQPSGKLRYAEDFLANLNWAVAGARYEKMVAGGAR
jgi:Fe-Mn family superoxide dismutase